jgi:DNA (cytosine-5)-methyltransferase 1
MIIKTIPLKNKNPFTPFSTIPPSTKKKPTVLELFAGGGGMALGFEQAGFRHVLLNELKKRCCETLRLNRPHWPVKHADISTLDFSNYKDKVDVVAGGFPCQAFSMAGKRQGFDDKRGALFFEYARAIQEIKPKLFIAENVKGLLFHDKGKTLDVILKTLSEAGYKVLPPQLLKAIHYRVPQKRERLFIVGIRNDIDLPFNFPLPEEEIYTVRDALKAGKLFNCDAPYSTGAHYSESKYKILDQVPEGGNWRDLSIEFQKEYLGKRHGLGSNSQLARRLSWNKPSYTLLTNPNSKLTERCHPVETRPLTVREYARLQTFPDDWAFAGAKSAQYAQIGNAVPVNLAKAIAQSAKDFLEKPSENNQEFLPSKKQIRQLRLKSEQSPLKVRTDLKKL